MCRAFLQNKKILTAGNTVIDFAHGQQKIGKISNNSVALIGV